MKFSLVKFSARVLPLVFFGGLTILPLVMWPWAQIPYEIPRVWFVQRWVEILIVLGIMALPLLLKRKNIDIPLLFLVFTFVTVAIFTSVFGVDLKKSLWGNFYRHDGLITLFHLVGLFIFMILFWGKTWERKLIQAISLGAITTSFWALILAFRLFILQDRSVDIWGNGAIGASFGNPNFLAGYLVVTLPFMTYPIIKSQKRQSHPLWLLGLIIQFLAIVTTHSWGGMLGSLLFVTGWIFIKRGKWRRIWPLIFIGLTGLIGFVYLRQSQSLGFVAEGRGRIIRKVLLGVAKRPILGWGWANADYTFEEVPWPIRLQHDVYVDKAHSMLLEVLATTGIVGLMVYIALLGRVGKLIIHWVKKGREDNLWPKTLLLVFLLYIFHSQTNIISIGEEVIFWLVVGIVGSEGGSKPCTEEKLD